MNVLVLKIGCKVTHFLSVTQVFSQKTDLYLHTEHLFVHYFTNFSDKKSR